MGTAIEISQAGDPITGATWGTTDGCQSGLLLVHGLGAHSLWFDSLGSRLAKHGIFSLAYDQVGFGLRKNQRFFSRTQWINDVCLAFHYLQSRLPNKPVFLLGNSMGAAVALQACSQINPAGLALLSPGFAGYPDTFRLGFQVQSLFKAICSPQAEISLPYGVELITASPDRQKEIEGDTQKRFSLPGKMLLELLLLTNNLHRLKSIKAPVLMLTAGEDRIVNNAASASIFRKIHSPHKIFRQLEGAYHDLMFDPSIDEVAHILYEWTVECTLM